MTEKFAYVAVALLMAIAGCAIVVPGQMSGKVVDKATGAAVPGVFVVYVWRSTSSFHGSTVCAYLSAQRTDAAGKFQFEDWGGLPGQRADTQDLARVYAPGYRAVSYGPGPIILERDSSSAGERLNTLRRVANGLGCFEKGPKSVLAEMFRAIADEAERLGGLNGVQLARHYRDLAVDSELMLAYSIGRTGTQKELR